MAESREMQLEAKVKILTEAVANQQADMKKMAAALLLYTQSNEFDSSLFEALNKMGKGNEALKTMFDNKLNGR